MTLPEALDAVRDAGATLALDSDGPLLRGLVAPEVVDVLRQHRDRVAAVLRLRQLHSAWGLDEADVAMIEAALLAGQITAINVITVLPSGTPVA